MKKVTTLAIFLLLASAGISAAQSCEDILFVPYENYFYDLGCVEFCVNDNGSRTICFGPFPAYCASQHPAVTGLPVIFGGGGQCLSCTRWDIPVVIWDWQVVSGSLYLCGTAQELEPPYGPACFSIEFYLGNWGTFDCWLPAELLSFNAVSVADGIEISFATASETNLNYFEIVREHDGNASVAGRVQARNEATGSSYTYLDQDVATGETYSYYLRTVDLDGSVEDHIDHTITVTWAPSAAIPNELALRAYPNPFNPATQLTYVVPEAGTIELKIFDAIGREVTTLVREYATAGEHHVEFDGRTLSSGTYFAQLQTTSEQRMTRLVLLK